jgi:hypothetical protein
VNDDLERRLKLGFGRAALPPAPDALLARVEDTLDRPRQPARSKRVSGWWLLVPVAALLAAAIGLVVAGGGARQSATVDGMPVLTVGEVLRQRSAGELGGESVAIGGYWSSALIGPISCAAPIGNPGDLELYCRVEDFGIAEREEPIAVLNPDGSVTVAEGPHLTPFLGNDLPRLSDLMRQIRPKRIAIVGHFDDPRARLCRPEAVQRCRDRLVIDRIASFDGPTSTGSISLPPLSVSNETSITVVLLVNGGIVDSVRPGERHDPVTMDLPPLPWLIEALSPSRRVLSSLSVSATDLITSTSGRAVRVDLSCGRLDVWSGPPLAGPMWSPGPLGDCD